MPQSFGRFEQNFTLITFVHTENNRMTPVQAEDVVCEVEATVDQIILRAAAKIGLNYVRRDFESIRKERLFFCEDKLKC